MQQNIYFRKSVWERLKDEPNKSQLVNELLEKHYNPLDQSWHKEPLGPVNLKELKSGTIVPKDPSKPSSFGRAPMDILKQGKGGRYNGDTPLPEIDPFLVPPVANISRASNGLCKTHGTPLDSRGRCLVKDCKYN